MEPLRKCRKCGLEAFTTEDLELFKQSKRSPHGRATHCKNCYNKDVLKGNRKRQIKLRYGISYEEYIEKMSSSDSCSICGSKKDLVYDHCHDSLEFRGVLCRNHNAAIGLLGDTSEHIYKAYQYLKEFENADRKK